MVLQRSITTVYNTTVSQQYKQDELDRGTLSSRFIIWHHFFRNFTSLGTEKNILFGVLTLVLIHLGTVQYLYDFLFALIMLKNIKFQ